MPASPAALVFEQRRDEGVRFFDRGGQGPDRLAIRVREPLDNIGRRRDLPRADAARGALDEMRGGALPGNVAGGLQALKLERCVPEEEPQDFLLKLLR